MIRKFESIFYNASKLLAFIAPLALLFSFSDMIYPYVSSKHLLFRLFVSLSLFFYLPLLFLNRKYWPARSGIFYSLLAFLFFLFLADIFAIYPQLAFWGNFERMEGLISYLYFFAYFLLLSTFLKSASARMEFLRFYILISFSIILWSIYAYIVGLANSKRLDAVFSNAIYLGIFSVFHVAISAYAAFKEKQALLRNAYIFSIPFALFVLWATASRGVFLSFVLALLLSFTVYAFKSANGKIKYVTVILYLLAAFSFLSIFTFKESQFVQSSTLLKRVSETSLNQGTLFSRLLLWDMTLSSAKERALLGWGQEGFNYVFNRYYNPKLWAHETWFDRSHNTPLDILNQGGLLSLLAYLAVLFFLWRYILFKVKDPAESALLSFIFASYFFSSLSIFDNISSYIPYFAMLALINARAAHLESAANTEEEKSFALSSRNHMVILLLSFSILILLLQNLYLSRQSAKAVASLLSVVSAWDLLERLDSVPLQLQNPELLKLKKKAISRFDDLGQHWRLAELSPTAHKEFFLAMSNPSVLRAIMQNRYIDDDTKKEYLSETLYLIREEAKKEKPYFMLLNSAAKWLAAAGYKQEAEELYLRLIKEAPDKTQFYEALAKLYIREKRYEEARKVLLQALEKEQGNQRILKALSDLELDK